MTLWVDLSIWASLPAPASAQEGLPAQLCPLEALNLQGRVRQL